MLLYSGELILLSIAKHEKTQGAGGEIVEMIQKHYGLFCLLFKCLSISLLSSIQLFGIR
jgi:hypothetical protein